MCMIERNTSTFTYVCLIDHFYEHMRVVSIGVEQAMKYLIRFINKPPLFLAFVFYILLACYQN